jgi:hypothetical protein
MATSTPSTKARDQKQAALDANKDVNLLNDNLASHEADAKKKITGQLRQANKKETTFVLTMVGDSNYGAGKVVALDDSFGVFKGNYLLDKCIHRIFRQGYITEIEGHKILKGHDTGKAPTATPAKAYSPGASVPPRLTLASGQTITPDWNTLSLGSGGLPPGGSPLLPGGG